MSKKSAFWLVGLLFIGGCADNNPKDDTQTSNIRPNTSVGGNQHRQPGIVIDEVNFPELKNMSPTARRRLQQMHTGEVDGFVNEEGFGYGRMLIRPTLPPLKEYDPNDPTNIENPNTARDIHKPFTKKVQQLVRDFGVLDLNRWTLQKVQLVGLTKGEPVAYETDKIPTMGELRTDVKTRELDEFEKKAVLAFGDNKRLKVIETNGELRVMGPIYATAACIKCHKTEGELLGAFSYTIKLHSVKDFPPNTPIVNPVP